MIPELQVSIEGHTGLIHMPSGDLPVAVRWDDGRPTITVPDGSDPTLVEELHAHIGAPGGGGS